MEKRKHIFWEIILLVGSIFAFRSAWHLMDKVAFFDRTDSLSLFFLLGIVLMSMSYYRIVHSEKHKN